MKAVFTELGVPNMIVSDGGPQYTSGEFKDFTKQWQIEHRVSSPRNPQSNGIAQRCVQTMKASLIKTIEEGEDVDLALLTYKTTPLSHRLPSQQSCWTPESTKLYIQFDSTNKTPGELHTDQRPKNAHTGTPGTYRNTRVLPRLKQSQKVVVQLDPDKNIWTPTEIVQYPTYDCRSYSLQTIHGGVYTRNRRFIKSDLTASEALVPQPTSVPTVTRPTRTIRRPDRLIESK